MKRIFTALLFTVVTITFAQESTLLRLNYNEGDKYIVKMNLDQNMGGGMMIMHMDIQMPIEVKSVNGDTYDTEMSFRKIAMNMEQGGMKISYDSDINEGDMDETTKTMHQQMKPVLETVLSAKTNNLGKVLEMKMIAGSGDASQFTNQTQSVTYPEEKIHVGYSWEEEKENNGMTIKSLYTVKSIDDKNVILDVGGAISGMADGTLSGEMQIDRLTGVPTESILNMDMNVMGQKATTTVKLNMLKE